RDARAAAALTLRCLPELPAAPQLPFRSRREGVVAQWAGAVPGVVVHDDGAIELGSAVDPFGPLCPSFDAAAHAGLLTFLDVASRQSRPPKRVKVQIAGPLTLGVAFVDAGMDSALAFPLGARVARAWAGAMAELVSQRLPDAALLCFLDEPALVCWRDADGPIEREAATDLLSNALAACGGASGVHVRWSRPRAGSPGTARARRSARCCSPARSATAYTTTRPRRSSPSARRFRPWPTARPELVRRKKSSNASGSCASSSTTTTSGTSCS